MAARSSALNGLQANHATNVFQTTSCVGCKYPSGFFGRTQREGMATTDKNIVSRQQIAFHDQTMFQITSQCDLEIRHECSERIDQLRTKNENTAENPQTLKTSAQTVDRTRKRQDPCQSTGYRTTGRADKTLCKGTGDRQEVFARRVVLEAESLTGSFAGSFSTYFSAESPCLKPGRKFHGKLPNGHARKVVRLQIPKMPARNGVSDTGKI